jgi:hypothetical protein
MAIEEALGPVDIGASDQELAAEPFYHRTAAPAAQRVRDVRARQLGEGADDDHEEQVEVALPGQHAREAEG